MKPPILEISQRECRGDRGIAGVLILMGLCFLGLIGFYLALVATTEIGISDNFEGHIRARYAALAGLYHARALTRGLCFDDLLRGPDGTCDQSPSYKVLARTFAFRNPLSWALARSIDIRNPDPSLMGAPDDGVVNSGKNGSMNGVALIPLTGIAQTAPDSGGAGLSVIARYFVRVCDNNGEAAEIAADPADDPFTDGDGVVIIRSMGIAQTIRETRENSISTNAVSAFEIRLKRLSTFNLDAALVIQGSNVLPSSGTMFDGTSFGIEGNNSIPGIATIDTDLNDSSAPAEAIRGYLAGNQGNNIQGAGTNPSIRDITQAISGHADKSLLLDKRWLWELTRSSIRRIADNALDGNQDWSEGNHPDLGIYDPAQPPGASGQRPRITCVDGNLSVSGAFEGGGLLVVSGKLFIGSGFIFNGIILVAGAGNIELSGTGSRINGGIYVAALSGIGDVLSWGTPRFTIGGTSRLGFNQQAVEMGVRLIPPVQQGFREITSTLDP